MGGVTVIYKPGLNPQLKRRLKGNCEHPYEHP
jgi:hypothetical protein